MTTKKVRVTYHAPKGDAKVTEMYGHTFFDGQSTEVELTEQQAAKIANNPVFMEPTAEQKAEAAAEAKAEKEKDNPKHK